MNHSYRTGFIFLAVFFVVVPLTSHAASGDINADRAPQESIAIVKKPKKAVSFSPYLGTPQSDAAVVLDVASRQFLYRQEPRKQRSIASLTKLFTTLVFLETEPNLDQLVTYSQSYDQIGAMVVLEDGEQVSLKQVLMGTLIPSANNMAMMLSHMMSYTPEQFLAQVNGRAKELHLGKTHIVEPTGLDANNVSTAGNLARLANVLFTQYVDIFAEAASFGRYPYITKNTNRDVVLYSTNKFDGHERFDVRAFKTGYLPGSAERTLVLKLRDRATTKEIIIVLLGNAEYGTIFDEAYELADWTFSNFEF